MCVYVCVCLYIYTRTYILRQREHKILRTSRGKDRQRDRQRDRQTDGQTDKQTDKQTERQTDRQTDRQTRLTRIHEELGKFAITIRHKGVASI